MKVEERPIDFINLLFYSQRIIYHNNCFKNYEKEKIRHVLVDLKKKALDIGFIERLKYLVTTYKNSLVKIVIFNFNHQKFFDDRQFLFKFKHFTGIDKIRFLTLPNNYHLFDSYLNEMAIPSCCKQNKFETKDEVYFINKL